MRESVSAPMTSTQSCAPLAMDCAPIASPYTTPSSPRKIERPAFSAPKASCTRHAVAGKLYSGVTVATMISPSSSGVTPATWSASLAAAIDSVAVVSLGEATMRRSRMPERETIHSSDVSTVLASPRS